MGDGGRGDNDATVRASSSPVTVRWAEAELSLYASGRHNISSGQARAGVRGTRPPADLTVAVADKSQLKLTVGYLLPLPRAPVSSLGMGHGGQVSLLLP